MTPAAAASRQRSRAGRRRGAPLSPSSSNAMDAGTTSPSVVRRSRKAATWLAIGCASACGSDDTRAYRAAWMGCITEYAFLNNVCCRLFAGQSGGVLRSGGWSCQDDADGAWKPLPMVLALADEGRGAVGRTPPQLFSVLTEATRWPGGRAPNTRHDLLIGLGKPSKTQPAGFKRALNLPELRVMAFSTDHDRLLVPEGLEGHGAWRAEAERREIPHHSWDVAGYVEYWSRTLTKGSQLCKECTFPIVGKCGTGWDGKVVRRRICRWTTQSPRPSQR
jgi:hypothetical protein